MSNTTNEINKVTGTIIRVSWKLIVYAVVVLLLYEGVTRGYMPISFILPRRRRSRG